MKFRVRQRIFSMTDSFDIEGENGQSTYTVKGKLFSFSSSQTLFNQNGGVEVEIKQKLFSLLQTCRLINNDGTEWLVKKNFWQFWASRFTIETPEGNLEMSGNIWDHEYEIFHQGRPIANISKKLFSFSDSYGVYIQEPRWATQLLAAVIVIDRIHHPGKKAKTANK